VIEISQHYSLGMFIEQPWKNWQAPHRKEMQRTMVAARLIAPPWSRRVRRTVMLAAALWLGITFFWPHVLVALADGPAAPTAPAATSGGTPSGTPPASSSPPAAAATAVPTPPAAAATGSGTPAATGPVSSNALARPVSGAATPQATPAANNVGINQTTTQLAVNVATTTVEPPNSTGTATPSTNSHPVAQANAQLAQNAGSVQVTGNDDTVTLVQVIQQVAVNVATALLFNMQNGSAGSVQLTQTNTNLGQNVAQVNVTVDGQVTTVNQTIFQAGSNTGTIQQPAAGSGQTAQTAQGNINLAQNSAVVVVSGNHDVVTVIQTIIQVAQNLGMTLVPVDGQTSAVGSTTQSNVQLGANDIAVSVSGDGNTVTISQGITQAALNQNTQLQQNPSVQPQLLFVLQPAGPAQVASSTITTSISPGSSVFVGTGVSDMATVTGSAPTGTISFIFFNNGSCAGTGAPAGTVPLTATSSTSATATSSSVAPTTPGSYAFIASYSGDASNAPATSGCEPLTAH